MKTDFCKPIVVYVHDKSGAYVTNTINGQRVSCTTSPKEAVERLARKLLDRDYLPIESGKSTGVPGESRWWIVPSPKRVEP